MSAKIVLAIDCGKVGCGSCDHRKKVRREEHCILFGAALPDWRRCPDCIEAQAQAALIETYRGHLKRMARKFRDVRFAKDFFWADLQIGCELLKRDEETVARLQDDLTAARLETALAVDRAALAAETRAQDRGPIPDPANIGVAARRPR